MAREMVVTRTRIVGRFVRLGELYFLCYSKATLSLSLSMLHYYHHSLCIFLCGIMRKLVAKIYQRVIGT